MSDANQSPPTPRDLASVSLPVRRLGKGTNLIRVHPHDLGPVWFSPAPGGAPLGRWDSPTGLFRVLYASLTLAVATAETLLRRPTQPLIPRTALRTRAVSVLGLVEAVHLVDLTGPGLSRLGLDARLVSGPYGPCGAWADAFHDHPSRPDGILYPSRFDPSGTCVALFDRVGPRLSVASDPVPLADMPGEVAAVLDRYGKALDPG